MSTMHAAVLCLLPLLLLLTTWGDVLRDVWLLGNARVL